MGAPVSQLHLRQPELDEWRQVADSIVDGLAAKTGLFEQFSGFFGLGICRSCRLCRPFRADGCRARPGKDENTQVVKQADVVALIALLPEEFPGGMARKNFRYYEPRCGHGSSLSPAMHGVAAARIGDAEMALQYFRQSTALDLSDSVVGMGGGVHIAALGANWMVAVLGFAGLAAGSDGLPRSKFAVGLAEDGFFGPSGAAAHSTSESIRWSRWWKPTSKAGSR